jgi:adenine-specific DNA-methyltransferase
MDKMKMESVDMTAKNIEKIGELFPNCITESADENGKLKKAINFDMLRQMLSDEVAEGDEAYEFTWVGKKAAIAEANRPIRKTLRPCVEESKNWDTTENLYIEGDNLEVLKLLQESYLGKVKMIYIDPPYNTGNDSFVYPDNFTMKKDEYEDGIGIKDAEGNIMFRENSDSNPRFHSDWCSMIYSRLILARNLLSDDGIIFISMDDNEETNIKKICDEVFGSKNCIGEMIRKTKSMTADDGNGFNLQHEMVYIYSKNKLQVMLFGEKKEFDNYSNPDNDPNGVWCPGDPSAKSGGSTTSFGIKNPYTNRIDYPPKGRYWAFSETTLKSYILSGKVKFKKEYKENERGFIFKRYKKDAKNKTEPVHSLFAIENGYMNQAATIEINKIFNDNLFSYPKPVLFVEKLVKYVTNKDSIVLDFFSGSATTAHAVMQLNAEDGGSRKFIMVQLPEETDEKSEAYKAGYKNICEIGKERIRRAGDKIKEENPLSTQDLDIGFRVLKLADSNMNDVYYSAGEYTQDLLSMLESNIKDDRTDLDLLFGCLLDWGLPLSMPYTSEKIEGCTVHTYNDGDLVACFDENVPESVIKAIAKRQPLRAVFRDNSFANSASKINVGEIFKMLAPDTSVKVI